MPPRKKELTEEEKEAKRLARNAYMRAYYAKNKAKKTTGPEPTGPSKAVEALKELRAEPKTGFVAKEEKLATKGGFKPRAKKAEAPGTSKLPPITKTTAKKATLKKLTKEEQAKRDAEEAEAKARREAADAEARQKEAETRARVLAEGKKAAEAVRPVPPPEPAPAPKTTMTEGQARVETLAGEVDDEFLALLGLKGKKARLEAEAKSKAEAPAAPPPPAPEKKKRVSKAEKEAEKEAKRQEDIRALEREIRSRGGTTHSIEKRRRELGLPSSFSEDVRLARRSLGATVVSFEGGRPKEVPDPGTDERIRQARARLSVAGGGALASLVAGFV